MAKKKKKNKNKKMHPSCILCKRKGPSDRREESLLIFEDIAICTTCARILGKCADAAIHMTGQEASDEPVNRETNHTEINIEPKQIKEYLDHFIISQDEAKEKIAVGTYNHYKRITHPELKLKKANILIAGPTGTGKTEIARRISEYLDIPILIRDVTNLTESGYAGGDVEDILKELLIMSGNDIEKAERGIIFLDEIDKLSSTEKGNVSREGVQQALLKMIEGTTVNITFKKNTPFEKKVSIRTHDILFIASGAFEGIEEKESKKSIGFERTDEDGSDTVSSITDRKLIKYGMLPEFIGRFPIVTQTKKLEKEDLLKILMETDDSVLKEYEASVKADGFYLKVTNDVINDIIEKAYNTSTGARSLRTNLDKYMEKVLYEIPSEKEKGKIVRVTKNGYELVERKEK